MIGNCHAYAQEQREAGRPIVGILCEYTPREIILAAGGVPVCLCGGSAETIPDAEKHLPVNLCPLIKSTYGYHQQGTNPFLEMASLIVGETTCDGKKKMYELLSERRPMFVLELPQKQNDPDALFHWVCELRKFKHAIEELFNVEICDARLREAIALMNRERAYQRALAALMKGGNPPITGRQLLSMRSSICCMPGDFAQYEKALAMFTGKSGPAARGDAVRVLITGVPMAHGAERVLEVIENSGGLAVCMENCSGLKPVIEDVDEAAPDSIQAIAEKYFHLPCSVMTKNDARMVSLRTLAAEYHAECIVELVWRGCLTYDVESYFVKRLAEEELGIPYLRIEADYSMSDSARIKVRCEALFETARGRR
jgi:benzoyl-CoA reductase/2-hydroxyglutaryl-CoA dehydratase subunit BcrC/BadD/HgdB